MTEGTVKIYVVKLVSSMNFGIDDIQTKHTGSIKAVHSTYKGSIICVNTSNVVWYITTTPPRDFLSALVNNQ